MEELARLQSHDLASTSSALAAHESPSIDQLLLSAVKQGHRRPSAAAACTQLLSKLTHVHINGLRLRHLEGLRHCPKLQVLYAYDNRLASLAGLQACRELAHLYVQNNQLSSLEELQQHGRLQKIYADGNCLASLQGLEACTRLEELHISQQHSADKPASDVTSAPLPLELDLQVLRALGNTLHVFSAASCDIHDPTPLAVLSRLHILDLSHNGLTDLEAVEQLLGALTGLKSLDLRGNPLTQQLKYRDAVILAASDRLVTLDGEPVTAKQREFLRREMQHLKAQQHQQQQKQQGGQGLMPQASSNGTGSSSSNSKGKLQFHPLQPPSHRPTAAGGFRAASARAKALRGNSIPCASEVEDVSLCMGGVAIGSPYSSAGGAL